MKAEGVLPRGVRYRSGVAASLAAEAVFMAMVAGVALIRGMDPWMVIRMPASFLLGADSMRPPGFVPDEVVIGLLMHLGLGILVGVLYAALLPRLGLPPVAGGLITGAMLYLLGFWILPLLFPVWLAPFWLPPTGKLLQALAHAIYGLAFGSVYRSLTRRPAD